jgi:hypothetical protein
VPTGPGDLADGDLLPGLSRRPPGPPQLAVEPGEDQARGDGLGVDAVRAPDHQGLAVLLGPPGAGRRRGRRRPGSRRPPRAAGWRRRRRARPRRSSPGAASAPARRPAPRRGSGRRSRRGASGLDLQDRGRVQLARRLLPHRRRRPRGTDPAASIASQAASSTAARSRSGGRRTRARRAAGGCSGRSSKRPLARRTALSLVAGTRTGPIQPAEPTRARNRPDLYRPTGITPLPTRIAPTPIATQNTAQIVPRLIQRCSPGLGGPHHQLQGSGQHQDGAAGDEEAQTLMNHPSPSVRRS